MSTVDATVEGEILEKKQQSITPRSTEELPSRPGSTSVYIEMWEPLLCYAKLKR